MKTARRLLILSCVAALLFPLHARAEAPKFIGTFEAVPMDVLMELPASVTEKLKSKLPTQSLVITEKDLSLTIGPGGGVYMTYTAQGDFLLGKTMLGKTEMFYPVYVKDADTLYLAGQKFVRKKADAK